MQTAILYVPSLNDALGTDRIAVDLANVLTALKGVAAMRFDETGHRVEVDFDPDYMSADGVRAAVEQAGYPVEDGAGT